MFSSQFLQRVFRLTKVYSLVVAIAFATSLIYFTVAELINGSWRTDGSIWFERALTSAIASALLSTLPTFMVGALVFRQFNKRFIYVLVWAVIAPLSILFFPFYLEVSACRASSLIGMGFDNCMQFGPIVALPPLLVLMALLAHKLLKRMPVVARR